METHIVSDNEVVANALKQLVEAADDMSRASSGGPMLFDVRTAMVALNRLKTAALHGHQVLNSIHKGK